MCRRTQKPCQECKEHVYKAMETPVTSATSSSTPAQTEFTSSTSFCPPTEDLFLLLQLDADVHLNADTGAISYMTPHCHSLGNYKPLHVPIRLADDQLVYSARVGSVVLRLILEGGGLRCRVYTHSACPVLQNNLLSVLFLNKCCNFAITFYSLRMDTEGL